jgi:predicted metal-binding protein
MLTGTYTPHKILEIATEEWGLRSKNGKKLSESLIYWMFKNPFYYGMFEYPKGTGLWHQGNHTPMITVEEFDRVQVLLGKKGKPRPKTHIFDFTGMMYCGECGAMITAETKTKHQKNGNTHIYVYYHCTKKKNPDCSQGSIEIKELNKQIIEAIDEVEIPPEFHAFGMKWFAKENEREASEHTAVLGGHQKAYNTVVTKLDRLIDMRANGELGQEEFTQKQAEYLEEKKTFKGLLDRTDVRIDQWNRTADEMLTFIEQAKEKFTNGSIQVRKRILSTLGSNLLIKDKILSIDIEKSLLPMKKISKEVKAIKERLEPVHFPKNVVNKGLKEKTNDFSSVFSTGLRG